MLRESLVAFALTTSACARDVVLPSQPLEAVCGDGKVAETEECDVESPACVECRVVPGHVCTRTRCFVPCGDGIVGDGEACEAPRKVEACDMTGYWVARESDYTRDRIVGSLQTASTWYLYRFTQTADTFHVEESIHCGAFVSGPATVEYTPASLRALMYQNDPTPRGGHGPRRGVFKEDSSGCAFSIDRWYTIRGAEPSLLPADFGAHVPLSTLLPLPSEADPVHPTGQNLHGGVDTDGDGLIGVAFRVDGIVRGIRNAAQRDFKEFASREDAPVMRNAIEFSVPGAFDVDEGVLSVTECGSGCALLSTRADAASDITNRITLRFVGKTLESARARSIIERSLRENIEDDLATCANARRALPHETTSP